MQQGLSNLARHFFGKLDGVLDDLAMASDEGTAPSTMPQTVAQLEKQEAVEKVLGRDVWAGKNLPAQLKPRHKYVA